MVRQFWLRTHIRCLRRRSSSFPSAYRQLSRDSCAVAELRWWRNSYELILLGARNQEHRMLSITFFLFWTETEQGGIQ